MGGWENGGKGETVKLRAILIAIGTV
jgi:hypothetical protein